MIKFHEGLSRDPRFAFDPKEIGDQPPSLALGKLLVAHALWDSEKKGHAKGMFTLLHNGGADLTEEDLVEIELVWSTLSRILLEGMSHEHYTNTAD